jgi:hypothetical protein
MMWVCRSSLTLKCGLSELESHEKERASASKSDSEDESLLHNLYATIRVELESLAAGLRARRRQSRY